MPGIVLAKATIPMVSSVNPTTVKPGDVMSISGKGFDMEGLDDLDFCARSPGVTVTPAQCRYRSVVAAYKTPRTHADYQGSKPDFRLEFISVTPTSAQVKVPMTIASGDGTYNLGWFHEYYAEDAGAIQAAQLVGFARYDQITVTGAGTGISRTTDATPLMRPVTPTSVPTPTPEPSPTALVPDQAPPSSSGAGSVANQVTNALRSVMRWFEKFLVVFRLR